MKTGPARLHSKTQNADYFRIRDYEYAQPLYDLAFLLEIEALMADREPPKYRIFSLWKAAYRIDSYASSIDRWLDGKLLEKDLDYVPSSRIRQYLEEVRATGGLREIAQFDPNISQKIFGLRSIRGIGAVGIAKAIREGFANSKGIAIPLASDSKHLNFSNSVEYNLNKYPNQWQAAHIVPPLLRFLREIELKYTCKCLSVILGIKDGIQPVQSPFVVHIQLDSRQVFNQFPIKALEAQPLFKQVLVTKEVSRIQHLQGWSFCLRLDPLLKNGKSIFSLSRRLDPLIRRKSSAMKGDLHLHSTWSDGNSEIFQTATELKKAGYEYFAITDHSRSSKIQGGLTPIQWVRQSISLQIQSIPLNILHGIEVDILNDGTLDLPKNLLQGMDIVIGSVHSNWSADINVNTSRLIRAIESGVIDVLGHPTSCLIGKPGVPNFTRPGASVDWIQVFKKCSQWRVALELNCFPSRLDLALPALRQAISYGCWISLGSDAHARTHLQHLKFGEAMLGGLRTDQIINRFSFSEITSWLLNARRHRRLLPVTNAELFSLDQIKKGESVRIEARINSVQALPRGGRVIGIDLTAGKGKSSGIALLEESDIQTFSLLTDDEILSFIQKQRPAYVSIDSPLGLPGGREKIFSSAGIVRIAERDLASIGVPAYPALIGSMKELTLRGMRLKERIGSLPNAPTVIESYPGAAQDILCIPRKQQGLRLLRQGLSDLGLTGSGLLTKSHDEMDAITSAVVARYFENGDYEPMGVPKEAQLIVPKVRPLLFEPDPIICLAGKSGAGKSVVARYLAVFYGFGWIRTREVIRSLLLKDIGKPNSEKLFHRSPDGQNITEQDLVDFGAVILNKYNQEPLRSELTSVISKTTGPQVVDSVRDLEDINPNSTGGRTLQIWYIEAKANVLSKRLKQRFLSREKGISKTTAIETRLSQLRAKADYIIHNDGTLEELRWSIDDTLCSTIILSP